MSSLSSSTRSSSDHTYSPPTPEDSRSPCPALNALANHDYLPHDGRNLTISQLVHALTQVYNLSLPLAFMLSATGVLKCGHGWYLDLHELAKHDVIEHDGSLTHADAPAGCPYAPTAVDRALVNQLLSVSPDSALTLRDFAEARALRDTALHAPLDSLHAEIARGEVVLTVEVLGEQSSLDKMGDAVPGEDCAEPKVLKTCVEQWFSEERLPDGWQKPSRTVGLFETAMKSKKLQKMVHSLLMTRTV